MNRHPLAIPGFLLAATVSVAADPGSWRTAELPKERGIVTSIVALPAGFAFGTSGGGVVSTDLDLRAERELADPAVKGRTVRGMAWVGGGLWIASDGGLVRWVPSTDSVERARPEIPASFRAEIRAVAGSAGMLWMANTRSVACVRPGRPDTWKEWKIPIPANPTALLRVGSRLLLGTEARGLLVLDSATSSWVRFGRNEGLSSDQVTGLEWVGAEVFVGTPEGLDVLDLSTQKARSLLPGVEVDWLGQSNGTLFAETTDGIVSVDPASRKASALVLPAGVSPEGAILAARERLVVACGNRVAVRAQPTLFGDAGLEMVPEGFSLALPRPLSPKGSIQAFLRIPEWPEAKMPLSVEGADGGNRLLVRTTSEARGLVQVDLVAQSDGKVVEIRSVEGVADRSKPTLVLDSLKSCVRDTAIDLRGRATGVSPLVLVRSPGSTKLALSSDGSFRDHLRLVRGPNRFQLSLQDALGNRTDREVAVLRDDQAPRIDAVADDTVSGDFARVRVQFHDESSVSASLRGPGQNRVTAFDSFAVVEVRGLATGPNLMVLSLEDEAGNSASRNIRIVRSAPVAGVSLSTSWSMDDYRVAPAAAQSTESGKGVNVVHYTMVEGETLCGVAQSFYGSQLLAPVLIHWNGFADSSQWRRMPIGTPVDIPYWRDLDYRNPDVRSLLDSFPWDRIPQGPKVRR